LCRHRVSGDSPACDRCGAPDADWHGDDLLCDVCWEGRLQADADRAYDYARDREMWEANDG
jgi:hypothetical protein